MWIGMASGRSRTFDIGVFYMTRGCGGMEKGKGKGKVSREKEWGFFWMTWFFGVGHSYRQLVLEDLMYMWHLIWIGA